MLLQGIAIFGLLFSYSLPILITALVLLGAGTALVYPNFITIVAENTHPTQRPQSLGIFRFWRDFGYVAGAVLAGIFGDLFGLEAVIIGTAVLTIAVGILSEVRMCCTRKLLWRSEVCNPVPCLN